MRFGRCLHEHILPDWASFYVNYNQYKRLIKTEAVPRDDIVSSLENELFRINSFYCEKYDIIEEAVEKLCRDRSCASLKELEDPSKLHISQRESIWAYEVITSIQQRLQKLLWYGRVNADAFRKICWKICPDKSDPYEAFKRSLFLSEIVNQRNCLRCFRQVNSLIAYVEESYLLKFGDSLSQDHAAFQRNILCSDEASKDFKDVFGRTALHHAAETGNVSACLRIINNKAALDRHSLPTAASWSGISLPDRDGFNPLHLGVCGGHVEVTKLFLDEMIKSDNPASESLMGKLLLIAVRSKFVVIAQLLTRYGADINYQDESGEVALYIAARSGQHELVEFLLSNQYSQPVLIDSKERSRGWTPLVAGCVYGRLSIVEMLLANGADQRIIDENSWTAKEHAAFQGHLLIMDCLSNHDSDHPVPNNEANPSKVDVSFSRRAIVNLQRNSSMLKLNSSSSSGPNDNNQILLVLGTSNLRKPSSVVQFDHSPSRSAAHIPQENGLALRIRATHSLDPSVVVPVPLLDDKMHEPFIFAVQHPDKVKIIFDLLECESYAEDTGVLLGSGIAPLHSITGTLTEKRETLVRDHSVPVLSKDNLECICSVSFYTFIARPYNGIRDPPSRRRAEGFWKKGGVTQVVGHRGSGANSSSTSNLQIGENTVQSFNTAGSLGASCVEFDVQLTRDFRTAVFHDFVVMETGGDVPLHSLTLEQFKLLGSSQLPRGYPAGMAETRYLESMKHEPNHHFKHRSLSLNNYDEFRVDDLHAKMRTTIEGSHEIKGNIRGSSIQEPFTTLEELLTKLPDSMAFDLEIKHPMLWETEDKNIDPIAIEANLFVDIILEKIYTFAENRNITFSSFSPEICILLAYKQQDYPVLFINKSGSQIAGDIRASNVQHAIRFAKSCGLEGIVLMTDPVVECPRLIHHAHRAGLICGTYGNKNDIPANAEMQAGAGLDAIVVNKVRLISQTLSKYFDHNPLGTRLKEP